MAVIQAGMPKRSGMFRAAATLGALGVVYGDIGTSPLYALKEAARAASHHTGTIMPDAVMGIAFAVIFPLTFLSNAFVPVDGLPSVLQALASWNPVSTVVAATRTLFGNPTALPSDAAWPLQHPVLCSFMWCVALIAVAAPLAVRRYRSRTTG